MSDSLIEALRADVAALEAENASLRAQLGAAATPYVPKPYPAWRYHTDGRAVLVADEAASDELGDGWSATKPDAAPVTYPAWRYHATASPRFVADAVEDAALPPGYYPSVAAAAAG